MIALVSPPPPAAAPSSKPIHGDWLSTAIFLSLIAIGCSFAVRVVVDEFMRRRHLRRVRESIDVLEPGEAES